MPLNDDQQLISRYLNGDEPALAELVKKHFSPLYGFLYRLSGNAADAEDLTQEVWLKIWKNLKKFDQTKKFKPWLYQIAKNTTWDWLRQRGRRPLIISENNDEAVALVETLADPAPLPDEIFARQNLAQELTAALQQLPLEQRAVITLYHQNQLTFAEIAVILQEPLNTVKSRYRRALFALRKILHP